MEGIQNIHFTLLSPLNLIPNVYRPQKLLKFGIYGSLRGLYERIHQIHKFSPYQAPLWAAVDNGLGDHVNMWYLFLHRVARVNIRKTLF